MKYFFPSAKNYSLKQFWKLWTKIHYWKSFPKIGKWDLLQRKTIIARKPKF